MAQTPVAGSTQGSFRVTESGAAEYRIPLRVPPGIAGMEPKLALAYNSQAGNGLLGMGWNLEGLSAITRCPRTIAQDGVRGGIGYDSNDRYCLDGQRLIPAGTEFRTERETFSKVVAHEAAGNGPKWFEVWTRSGQIIEYGRTDDSRIEAQGKPTTVRAWAVSKIRDRAGNQVAFKYAENSAIGEYLIEQIDYATSSVQFFYEARPDVRNGYVAGSKLDATQRLGKVRTFRDATLAKEYRLAYQASPTTGRSRLAGVSECDQAGACFAATTFAWQNATPGWTQAASFAPPTVISHFTGSVNYDNGVRVVDVNGDGRADYLQCETSGACHAWVSTGTGWQHSPQYAPPTAISHFYNNFNIDYGVRIVDVNGDGLADYLKCEGGGACEAWLNTGSGWQPNSAYAPPTALTYFYTANGYVNIDFGVRIVDVNGDALPDWLKCEGGGACQAWLNTGSGWQPSAAYAPPTALTYFYNNFNINYGVEIVDVNGDGLADYLKCEGGAPCQAWLNTGSGWQASSAYAPPTPLTYFYTANGYINIDYGVRVIDVNGDGLPDFLKCEGGGPCRAWVNTGAGWLENAAYAPPTPISYFYGYFNIDYGVRLVDVNGDGLVDYLQCEAGAPCRAWLNTGTGWQQNAAYAPPTALTNFYTGGASWVNIDYGVRIEDVSGDGLPEFLQCETSGHCKGFKISGPYPDLLLGIADGLGESVAVTYKPMTDGSVYARETTGSYPLQNLQSSMYVVSSYSRSLGVGGSSQLSYFYTGAKVDLSGRGFLGPRLVQSTDAQGVAERITLRQDWPYVGLPSSISKTRSSGAPLREVTNQYDCRNPLDGSACTVAAGNRYFPFVWRSVESGNDLGGAALPTVTTDTQYDGFGNPTRVEVSTPDGYSKTTTNTFEAPDEASWRLGRLKRSTVQSP